MDKSGAQEVGSADTDSSSPKPDARFVTIRLVERRMTFLENYSHRHN